MMMMKKLASFLNGVLRRRKRVHAAVHESRVGDLGPVGWMGVTIRTPSYAELSEEAVRRFKQHSGLPCVVIDCGDEEAFGMKLKLDTVAPRCQCIVFDADWWALRPFDFSGWCGAAWGMVHDRGIHHPAAFARYDCERQGIVPEYYGNTGFFLCDLSREDHREVFARARGYAAEVRAGGRVAFADFGEQSMLNLAVQQAGVPVNLLPDEYNFFRALVEHGMKSEIPGQVIGLHAAGVGLEGKLAHLRVMAEALSYAATPLLPGVVHFEHSMMKRA